MKCISVTPSRPSSISSSCLQNLKHCVRLSIHFQAACSRTDSHHEYYWSAVSGFSTQGQFTTSDEGPIEGRRLMTEYRSQRLHDTADYSPPLSLLVSSAPIYQPRFLAYINPARIIANQPLRAKEASPFIDHKYAIVVRTCATSASRTCSCDFVGPRI